MTSHPFGRRLIVLCAYCGTNEALRGRSCCSECEEIADLVVSLDRDGLLDDDLDVVWPERAAAAVAPRADGAAARRVAVLVLLFVALAMIFVGFGGGQ
jgi:hypothetical protein